MPKPRYRIWMVMVLVGVAGLVMGAYREAQKEQKAREVVGRVKLSHLSICVALPGRPVEIKVANRRPSDIPYPEVAPIVLDSDRPPLSPSPCPSPESASGR
jgi:hypothetical protein